MSRIASRCIEAHQVARYYFEVLEVKGSFSFGLFRVLAIRQGSGLFRAAIHGVVELQILDAEIIRRFNGNGHFFDGTNVWVASWTQNANGGWLIFLRLNEVVVRDADCVAVVQRSDVIRTILIDWQRSLQPVIA